VDVSLTRRIEPLAESSAADPEIAMPSNPSTSKDAAEASTSELLTPNEYAKAAKISLSWLAKARKRGDGPRFIRFGRSVRYYPPKNNG